MRITSVDVWTVVVPTIPGRVNSTELEPKVRWDELPKHMVRLNTDTDLFRRCTQSTHWVGSLACNRRTERPN